VFCISGRIIISLMFIGGWPPGPNCVACRLARTKYCSMTTKK
jgi:hypothetical protein